MEQPPHSSFARTAILLDFGGVLVLPSTERVKLALAELDIEISAEALDRAFYNGISSLDKGEPAPFEDVSAWRYVDGFIAALGVVDSCSALRRDVEVAFIGREKPWSRVAPDCFETIRELQRRGHSIAVVSNSDGRVERKLREMGISRIGEGADLEIGAIVDSHIVGVRKPDAGIFHIALAKIDAAATEAVHVGDSVIYDVRGAQAASVRPLHLDPWGLCRERDHEDIRSLSDLLQLL